MADELIPYRGPALEGTVETQVDCKCEPPTKLWPGESCWRCGAIAVKFDAKKGKWERVVRDGDSVRHGCSIVDDILSMIRIIEETEERRPEGVTIVADEVADVSEALYKEIESRVDKTRAPVRGGTVRGLVTDGN